MNLVALYNLALARVAVTKFIVATTDRNQQADVLNVFYPLCAARLLEKYPWSFAQRHASMPLVASADDTPTPLWAGRWAYGYAVPADALVVRSLAWSVGTAPGSFVTPPEEFEDRRAGFWSNPIPWELEDDGAGNVLVLTNAPQAVAVYTARITDVTRFPPSFASALAWLLASEIATPLSISDGVRNKAIAEYEAELSRAMAADANARQDRPPRDAEFIRVR